MCLFHKKTIGIINVASFFCANFTKFQKISHISCIVVFFVSKSIAKSKKIVYNCVKSGEKWIKVVKSGKFPSFSIRKGSEKLV